jgi:HK97 gp10 family phage protein
MNIEWKEDKFLKSLSNYVEKLESRGTLAVKRGLHEIRRQVVMLTPVKTGRLKGSINGVTESIFDVKKGTKTIIGTIGTAVPYAKPVEFGTSRFKGRRMFTRGIFNSKSNVQSIIKSTLQGK